MAREFEVEVSSSATPEQILAAFGRTEYWHDRFAEFDNHTVLDDLTVDGGRTEVVTVQDLGHDALPSLLTKVYRRGLTIRTTETWVTVEKDVVRGELVVEVTGAPGSGGGTAEIAPDGDGSRMTFSGVVAVPVPLLGGKIESHVAQEFTLHIPVIQEFTTEWVRTHD
ncbi:DUF2505 domain-containing protein [Gordonia sp. w5E2]|uniref:DUF2505 domain-containing protein n=1 Tax=Gordonia jacobaea TaxID=122202 RepID=A0ABR5IHZ5_9ACTN|nr:MULTISPECIES: DUF2505 domain-containing protein [Gordonia]KNA93314.1 hypothetical protein ABW18_02630 [Gordonia jacobaea]SKZ38283.1 Protein of uncharacterised function (DUF2505) [Mycobacteroides abscessus subsp. abscessus]